MNYFTSCWRVQSFALLDQPGSVSIETIKLAHLVYLIYKQRFGISHNALAGSELCFELVHFVHCAFSNIHR